MDWIVWATDNIYDKMRKYYIILFIKSNYDLWTATVLEPDKYEHWEWVDPDDLLTPLFLLILNLFAQWQKL